MIKIDRVKCIYCGGCVSVCPVNALTLDETVILCNDKCIDCGVCIRFCPVDAIRFADGSKEMTAQSKAQIMKQVQKMEKQVA